MRFVLQSTSNFGRRGMISNLPRLKEFEMETPHVLLHTAGGTVPHLTYEVLQMVTKENLGLNLPIQSISQVQEQVKLFKNSIADYIGMKEYLTYCSFMNPCDEEINSSHYKEEISFKTRHGRKFFSAASYMELMKDLKPDMFVLLADGWTNAESSKRRIYKSFENSAKLFEKCMEIYNNSVSLKSSAILGALEGGSDVFLREEASKLIGKSSVFGVVIDGLLNTTDAILNTTFSDIQPFIKASLKHIPEDKLRIIHGCWNPSVVLALIENGIDMFDSSYLTHIAEIGGALTFPNSEEVLKRHKNEFFEEKKNDLENKNENPLIEADTEGPSPKKIKLSTNSRYFMSLKDPCHSTDFTPINKHCSCLACRNHTRAYIHHLVSVDELLGRILLMIHNLHHYLVFFSTIRSTLKNKKFSEFKKDFQTWCDAVKDSSSPS